MFLKREKTIHFGYKKIFMCANQLYDLQSKKKNALKKLDNEAQQFKVVMKRKITNIIQLYVFQQSSITEFQLKWCVLFPISLAWYGQSIVSFNFRLRYVENVSCIMDVWQLIWLSARKERPVPDIDVSKFQTLLMVKCKKNIICVKVVAKNAPKARKNL